MPAVPLVFESAGRSRFWLLRKRFFLGPKKLTLATVLLRNLPRCSQRSAWAPALFFLLQGPTVTSQSMIIWLKERAFGTGMRRISFSFFVVGSCRRPLAVKTTLALPAIALLARGALALAWTSVSGVAKPTSEVRGSTVTA